MATTADQCLSEILDFTAGLITFMTTLMDRKARDIRHLDQRLVQHAEERRHAIDRDNADDVRRADRDRAETARSLELSRRALGNLQEQRKRATSELLEALILVHNRHLSTMVYQASVFALSLCKTSDDPDQRRRAEAINLLAVSSGGSGAGEPSLEQRIAAFPDLKVSEEAFTVPAELVTAELNDHDLDAELAKFVVQRLQNKSAAAAAAAPQPASARSHSSPSSGMEIAKGVEVLPQGQTATGVTWPTGEGPDLVASYLMDIGMEPAAAIVAAQNLVSSGLTKPSMLQQSDVSVLTASGISADHILRIQSHREPDQVLSELEQYRRQYVGEHPDAAAGGGGASAPDHSLSVSRQTQL